MTSKTIAKYTLLFVFAFVCAFSLGKLVGALAVARPLSPQFGLICSGLWAGIELTEVALKHAPQAINKAVDL